MREAAEATVAVSSDSEVIFEGRVERQEPTSIDILQLANDPHTEDKAHRTVFFAVTRVYRGAEREIFKVETGWGGGDCGFDAADNELLLLWPGGEEALTRGAKADLARALIARIAGLRKAGAVQKKPKAVKQ